MFQLRGDKASGPNGFPISFYQTFWDVIKKDIYLNFQEHYERWLSTCVVDYTYVCLIPKKEGAVRANDFRPISFLNGIQIIISKVLANRQEGFMQDLISTSLSAFLKRRLLADAFVTANELVAWCYKEAVEGVKVDFEKAYDKVN